jgi:hypothetical protein
MSRLFNRPARDGGRLSAMTGAPTVADTRHHLHTVLTDLAGVVDGIDEDRRHAPTPCTQFDVAALLDHVVGWLETFSAGYADPEGRAPRTRRRPSARPHRPSTPRSPPEPVRAR